MPNDSVAYGCVNMNVMGTTFTGGLHLIFLSKSDGNYGFVERNSYSDGNEGGDRVRKILRAGVWQPWEHFDPPLMIGPEYRTTERYLGKPVYVKMVDFGALPNASYKFVGIENGASIIRVSALASNGKTLPGSIGASQREQVLCMGSSNSVEIITYADASSLTATVTAWYTKATD